MCLLVFAVPAREGEAFVLGANRDEAHARRTARAAWWADAPDVFGGRDAEQGGTWLAASRAGRLAAVTNHRRVPFERRGPSRGWLVRDFVCGDERARAYVERRREDGFHAFNFVAWDGREAASLDDAGEARALAPGVHGLSNGRIDEPWPKVERAKGALAAALARPRAAIERALFATLADREGAPDAHLPDTGVGLGAERLLAPPFVVSPVYGTRSSTVLVAAPGEIAFEERSFDAAGVETARVREIWRAA